MVQQFTQTAAQKNLLRGKAYMNTEEDDEGYLYMICGVISASVQRALHQTPQIQTPQSRPEDPLTMAHNCWESLKCPQVSSNGHIHFLRNTTMSLVLFCTNPSHTQYIVVCADAQGFLKIAENYSF